MPLHDWTRVIDGAFHHFHLCWIVEIKRSLKRDLLPPQYFVMVERLGGDLDNLDSRTSSSKAADDADNERAIYARLARTLVVRHSSNDRIVAMIEVLSPGNKSSRHSIRSLIDKVVAALDGGIHLLFIDVHPPGPRDPDGIHGLVMNEIGSEDFALASDRLRTAVAYRSGLECEAFVNHFDIGEPIPPMPLFLTRDNYITLPLEPSYQAAWEDVPSQFQATLSGNDAPPEQS